jgi:hypothetical protein
MVRYGCHLVVTKIRSFQRIRNKAKDRKRYIDTAVGCEFHVLQAQTERSTRRLGCVGTAVFVVASLALPTGGHAGSARDYLNAPIDSWLTT